MKYSVSPSNSRWPVIIAIVAAAAVIVLGSATFGVHKLYNSNLQPVSSNQRSMTVTIPRGSSLGEVAKQLKKLGIIRSEWAFTQYVRNQQASDDIKAGTYGLSPSQSVQEIVSIITEGKIKTNLITILPGQRLDQIKKTFISSGFSGAAVAKALDPGLYRNHPALADKPSNSNLEGYLYPDSFQKISDTRPEEIIEKSLDEMHETLTPELRNAIVAKGLTVHQGVILASIIQQEADEPEDRNRVAQVFLSRLRIKMKLESDATAPYGAVIARKEPSLAYDSRYNTYLYKGLPPGPISNVTSSSLEAVANPANTDYLYFVAGDDGTVYFSKTLSEHQILVSKYCHKKCSGL